MCRTNRNCIRSFWEDTCARSTRPVTLTHDGVCTHMFKGGNRPLDVTGRDSDGSSEDAALHGPSAKHNKALCRDLKTLAFQTNKLLIIEVIKPTEL
jgi:hypothetical protein